MSLCNIERGIRLFLEPPFLLKERRNPVQNYFSAVSWNFQEEMDQTEPIESELSC